MTGGTCRIVGCGHPVILAGLCAGCFADSDLDVKATVKKCGWCSEPSIVETSCSAPACAKHVRHAMEQVGLVMMHVRQEWETAVPPVPATEDSAIRLAQKRARRPRRIEDVQLP